jgi:serine/threonine-protein kinase HipA
VSVTELIALLNDTPVGHVLRDNHGRLKFVYDDSWRLRTDAYPLSLSMPLGTKEHSHRVIESFLWGLLPDNAMVLENWGRQFQVSSRNAFALLSHVGEDCAGAIQFVREDRLETARSKGRNAVEWLDEKDIAERLRILRADPSAARLQQDHGHFSLAGAQPKTALLLEKGRWGVPSGRIPTTHILKPAAGHLTGFIENEHLCLQLAGALGFPVASSRLLNFDGELAIAVERFDRVHTAKGWTRIHQEDFCQALGKPPALKYQSHGGPGPKDMVDLLRTHSSAAAVDTVTFVDALALNWLIGGTDGHAKNFGLLIGPGRVRLAPLYDVASILPYPQFDLKRAKLAMKIADRYRIQAIGRREWLKIASQLQLASGALLARIVHMAEAIPELATEIGSALARAGLSSAVIDRLVTRLAGRAKGCLAALSR